MNNNEKSTVDYLNVINKYIPPTSKFYKIYIIHVVLVTQKALKIADKLGLADNQKRFIEEASMLHDIGAIKTKEDSLGLSGNKHYLAHGYEGYLLLNNEGLPKHALVARNHNGGGIFKYEVIDRKLDIPVDDYVAQTLEEKIIAYSDLFYCKVPKVVFRERKIEHVYQIYEKIGQRHLTNVKKWHEMFG